MSNIQQSVIYLRSRSLGARLAMLWGGSLVIFFVVSFLWIGQIRYKLATSFYFEPGASRLAAGASFHEAQTPVAANPAPKAIALSATPMPSSLDDNVSGVGGIIGLIKRGAAGLVSLLQGKSLSLAPSSRQEGQELDQFLKYQQEYYRPLPAGQ